MSYHDAHILDQYAYQASVVHRLDPRAKIIAILFFVIIVVSFPKYVFISLLPFAIYPLVLAILSGLSFRLLFRQVLIASPFFILVGLFNPFLDRTMIDVPFLGIQVRGGIISFASIALRGFLCVSGAVLLVSTSSFPRLVEALQALHLPKAFTVQLMFLYRYLFLLIEEAKRMSQARLLRSGGFRNSFSSARSMLSVLLIRTLHRAGAIWLAMRARGFQDEIKTARKMKWSFKDFIFLALSIFFCFLLRLIVFEKIKF